MRGENPAASPAQIEGLLDWIVAHQNDPSGTTRIGGLDVPVNSVNARIIAYLDHALFSRNADPYRVLGLTPTCTAVAIRGRYKRLLQVFHPDRHADDQGWFTSCTEEINRAYAYLKVNHGKPGGAEAPFEGLATRPGRPGADSEWRRREQKPAATVNINKTRVRRRLHTLLGDSGTLKKRVYIAMFVIPAALLLIVYMNNPVLVSERKVTTAQNTPDVSRQDMEHSKEQGISLSIDSPINTKQPLETKTVVISAGIKAAKLDIEPDDAANVERQALHEGRGGEHDSAEIIPNRDDAIALVALSGGSAESAPAKSNQIAESATPAAIAEEQGPVLTPETTESPSVAVGETATSEELTREPVEKIEPAEETGAEIPDDRSAERTIDPAIVPVITPGRETKMDDVEPGQSSESLEADVITEPTATLSSARSQRSEGRTVDKPTALSARQPVIFPITVEPASTAKSVTKSGGFQVANKRPENEKKTPETVSGKQKTSKQIATTEGAAGKALTGSAAASAKSEPAAANASAVTPTMQRESDIKAVKSLMGAYQAHYNRAELDEIMALFRPDASAAGMDDKLGVRQNHSDLFRLTADRTLIFGNTDIEVLAGRQYKVSARYAEERLWIYPKGLTTKESGLFQVQFVLTDGEFKIWRLMK